MGLGPIIASFLEFSPYNLLRDIVVIEEQFLLNSLLIIGACIQKKFVSHFRPSSEAILLQKLNVSTATLVLMGSGGSVFNQKLSIDIETRQDDAT